MPRGGLTITILLIDDEPSIREILALLLTSLGHSVIQAASGNDGIAALEANDVVQLVLTDLKMPGLDGRDVIRIVRDRWPWLRVGVVSGSHDAVAECRHLVDVAITKPVGRDDLRTLLDRLAES